MSKQEVVHAYRHLYRGLLHAVQFSIKGRYIVRDQLRKAFRASNATFDGEGVQRTLFFLEAAAKERGLEHKILKNLVRAAHWRNRPTPWRVQLRDGMSPKKGAVIAAEKTKAVPYMHYDMTVAMLNKSLGLCLR